MLKYYKEDFIAARKDKLMNIEEAKVLLSFHSTRNSDIDNPK